MRIVVSLIAGLLFGVGLTVSDMIDPARVQAFLDVAGGAWDPTLGFVMGGAVMPMAVAWIISRRRRAPLLGSDYPNPPTRIDGRLLAGASVFGVGWGLVGICPGPALSALSVGGVQVAIFVAAMVSGIVIYGFLLRPYLDAAR